MSRSFSPRFHKPVTTSLTFGDLQNYDISRTNRTIHLSSTKKKKSYKVTFKLSSLHHMVRVTGTRTEVQVLGLLTCSTCSPISFSLFHLLWAPGSDPSFNPTDDIHMYHLVFCRLLLLVKSVHRTYHSKCLTHTHTHTHTKAHNAHTQAHTHIHTDTMHKHTHTHTHTQWHISDGVKSYSTIFTGVLLYCSLFFKSVHFYVGKAYHD